MTLAEIEDTLENLKGRHPGLDEALLITLLRAGGWEEKEIQEAVSLFEGASGEKTRVAFPAPQKTLNLPEEVDNDHLLQSGKENEGSAAEKPKNDEKIGEPQSLNPSVPLSKHEELPHDLPLRPFETSDHIWPFSRYKDVFYGDLPEEEPLAPAPSVSIPAPIKEEIAAPIETPKVQAPIFIREGPKVSPQTVSEKASAQGEDKLVILACAMLVAVLFVLGYMYSNGRL